MGPGGYKYRDFWKLGLPMEIIIAVVAVPLILYFWPLQPADNTLRQPQQQPAVIENQMCRAEIGNNRFA